MFLSGGYYLYNLFPVFSLLMDGDPVNVIKFFVVAVVVIIVLFLLSVDPFNFIYVFVYAGAGLTVYALKIGAFNDE